MLGHTLTGLWQVYDQHEYQPEQAKPYGNPIQQLENFDEECIKAIGSAYGGTMESFSRRQGYPGPAAEISIRHEAAEALRAAVVSIAYPRGFAPSELRPVLCRNLARRVGDTS